MLPTIKGEPLTDGNSSTRILGTLCWNPGCETRDENVKARVNPKASVLLSHGLFIGFTEGVATPAVTASEKLRQQGVFGQIQGYQREFHR